MGYNNELFLQNSIALLQHYESKQIFNTYICKKIYVESLFAIKKIRVSLYDFKVTSHCHLLRIWKQKCFLRVD